MAFSTAREGNASNQESELDFSSQPQPTAPGDGPHQRTTPEITPTCQPASEIMSVYTATPGEAVTSECEHAIPEDGPDQETPSNIPRPPQIPEKERPSSRAASGDTQNPATAGALLEKTKKHWSNAIQWKDCKYLIRILDDSSEDVSLAIIKQEIAEKSRTALHVAVMQGCGVLIERLRNLTSKFPRIWDQYFAAKDVESSFTASEMLSYCCASHTTRGAMRRVYHPLSEGITARYQDLNDVVAQVDWPEELKQEFNEDVDFNFEPGNQIVFRFHHACKVRMKQSVAHQYLEKIWKLLHSNLLKESLCGMEDLQGRAPLEHYMADSIEPSSEVRTWLLQHTPAIVAIRISRRHIILKYIQVDGDVEQLNFQDIYQLLGCSEFSLKGDTVSRDTDLSWRVSMAFKCLLDLLIFLRCTREAVTEITTTANHQGWVIYRSFDQTFKDYPLATIPSICLVASIGDPANLQLLLRNKFDPFIYGDRSRTALHYAVDTTFQLGSLGLQYFSTGISIQTYRDLKSTWKQKNKDPNHIDYVGKQACCNMLLRAGLDIWKQDKDGEIPDPKLPMLYPKHHKLLLSEIKNEGGHDKDGNDQLEHQNWWNEKLVNDTIESKNAFNQASNALSVVGTLVAATSYVGPLQPPLSYSHDGYVDITQVLIRMFMVSNTLAFYLAIASVMFVVVPSLPMPQEGVVEELRRARHNVALSLCLLLASILCIITSFASASMIVIGPREHPSSLLMSPTIIGLIFCSISIFGFLIRVLRLVFYRYAFIRHIYKFSFTRTFRSVLSKLVRTKPLTLNVLETSPDIEDSPNSDYLNIPY